MSCLLDFKPDFIEIFIAYFIYQASVAPWWYNYFSEPWAKACGISKKHLEKNSRGMPTSLLLDGIARFVFIFVYSMFLQFFNADTLGKHIQVALWVWLGFIVTQYLSPVIWEFKNLDYLVYNAGEKLLSLLAANIFFYLWTNAPISST